MTSTPKNMKSLCKLQIFQVIMFKDPRRNQLSPVNTFNTQCVC